MDSTCVLPRGQAIQPGGQTESLEQRLADSIAACLPFADLEHDGPCPPELSEDDLAEASKSQPGSPIFRLMGLYTAAAELIDPFYPWDHAPATEEELVTLARERRKTAEGIANELWSVAADTERLVPPGVERAEWVKLDRIAAQMAAYNKASRAQDQEGMASAEAELVSAGIRVEHEWPIEFAVGPPDDRGVHRISARYRGDTFVDEVALAADWKRRKACESIAAHFGIRRGLLTDQNGVPLINRMVEAAAATDNKKTEGDENPKPPPAGYVPTSRDELLSVLNNALIGKYGGRVEVARVEKLGARGGQFVLVTRGGRRITLGGLAKIRSVTAVMEAVADQTDPPVLIPMEKKTWPLVVHAILTLAEIKPEGISDRVAAWLREYVAYCIGSFDRRQVRGRGDGDYPAMGTAEWFDLNFVAIGNREAEGAFKGLDGQLCIIFDCFCRYCRSYERGGAEIKPAEIQRALTDLGFESGHRIEGRIGSRRTQKRVWMHPSFDEWT